MPQLFLLSFLVSLLCVSASQAAVMLKHSGKALPSLPKVVSTRQVCVKLNKEPFQCSSREPLADRSNNDIFLGMRSFLLPASIRNAGCYFKAAMELGGWD